MRALLVEDHARLAEFVGKAVRELGLAVDVAGTARRALDCIGEAEYDLMILDLMLPDGSGLDVLRQTRALGKDWPIIIVSARDQVGDRVTGLDAGADDYLTKPFSVAELSARVRALLRRPQRFERLHVGDLVIDPVERRASSGETDLELRPKEFTLLEALARQAGVAVARTELIECVWGAQMGGLDNALEAQISALRRALRQSGAAVQIETIRNVGYRLSAIEAA